MASRKKLGVGRDQNLVGSVAREVGPDEHAGAGQLMDLEVAKVTGNERNPRARAVTPDEVARLRDDARAAVGTGNDTVSDQFFDTVDRLIDEWEPRASSASLSIQDCRDRLHNVAALAQSIGQINLIQPIVVYPVDNGYEVVAGQRRYLAHVLLGRREIRGIVRQPSGDRLQDNLAAVVENLSREELSLRERVEAIAEIADLSGQGGQMSAAELQRYIGETRRSCQRYLRIVRDARVLEGVRSGEVTSLRQAAQLADGGGTGGAAEGPGEAGSGRLTRSAPTQRTGHPGGGEEAAGGAPPRGRPKRRARLGSVSDGSAVARLIRVVVGEERFDAQYGDVDWDDLQQVERVWQQFWKDHVAASSEGEA